MCNERVFDDHEDNISLTTYDINFEVVVSNRRLMISLSVSRSREVCSFKSFPNPNRPSDLTKLFIRNSSETDPANQMR